VISRRRDTSGQTDPLLELPAVIYLLNGRRRRHAQESPRLSTTAKNRERTGPHLPPACSRESGNDLEASTALLLRLALNTPIAAPIAVGVTYPRHRRAELLRIALFWGSCRSRGSGVLRGPSHRCAQTIAYRRSLGPRAGTHAILKMRTGRRIAPRCIGRHAKTQCSVSPLNRRTWF